MHPAHQFTHYAVTFEITGCGMPVSDVILVTEGFTCPGCREDYKERFSPVKIEEDRPKPKPRKVKTLDQVRRIISRITFAPSCLDMGWKWEVKEIDDGFMIRSTFQRPDAYSNCEEMGTGYGRWMICDKDCSTAGIIKTAWLCAELIVRHELMEAFLYREARIFNPHKSLTDLAYPETFAEELED